MTNAVFAFGLPILFGANIEDFFFKVDVLPSEVEEFAEADSGVEQHSVMGVKPGGDELE